MKKKRKEAREIWGERDREPHAHRSLHTQENRGDGEERSYTTDNSFDPLFC